MSQQAAAGAQQAEPLQPVTFMVPVITGLSVEAQEIMSRAEARASKSFMAVSEADSAPSGKAESRHT